MAVHINTLNGGNITITTGGSTPEPTAPQGKVLYKTSADGEWLQSDADITNGTFNGFNEKSSAVAVIIPSKDANGNDVTSVGDYVFEDCWDLTSVLLPDSVTSIGNGALKGCSGFTSITIPSSVTTFGDSIIEGCDNLHTVNLPGKTCDDADDLSQSGKISRPPSGEEDYMDYICSDGTYSIVAVWSGDDSMYLWEVVEQEIPGEQP